MKEKYNIIEAAAKLGNFQVFTNLLNEARLEQSLRETGPYTVFAPTDEAFSRVPRTKLEDLRKPENRETLRLILSHHIVPAKLLVRDLKRLDSVKTTRGEELRIESRAGLWVNEAQVFSPDLEASNGVIHVIDTVLWPEIHTQADWQLPG